MQKSAAKQNISLFIFLFINFAFVIKYADRVTHYASVVACALVLFQLLLWHKRDYILKVSKYLNIADVIILSIFIFVCAYLFIKIPVLSLKVDRATVISSFWENYFNNEYVYFAKSHRGNPPGPMPFYYIMALPFYLMGELGYFSILGLILFYLIIRFTVPAKHYKTLTIILLLSSFFYLWEVICRSNLILNGSVVLLSLLYFFSKREHDLKFLFITGILTGLTISTRNVYVIPYIIAFLYALKDKKISFKQCFSIGCIAVLVFALTFLPFVLGYWQEFLTMNPFIVQSGYLMPFKYTLVFIVMAFIASLISKTALDVYFYSAVVLFLTIIGYFLYHIVNKGFQIAFYESWADISYFILCVPFALYYLFKTQSENENGKVETKIIM